MTGRATITPFNRSQTESTIPICSNPPHYWIINEENFGTCRHGCKYQFPYSDQDSFTENNTRIYLQVDLIRLPYQ